MPCDTQLRFGQKIEERRKQVEDTVSKLEAALGAGTVKVIVGPEGSIVFAGWGSERNGVSDLCAYRRLSAKGSWALRQAVAKAEALSGKKINAQAVGSGIHSHDGGKTWDKGHKK